MTRRAMILLALLVLVLGWGVAKESQEPYLRLFLDDILHPKPAPLSVPVADGLTLRLYSDTRPHIGKVARLQKALVLVDDGRERVEEGFGFGLPLVHVGGQAYLSRTASVSAQGNVLVKRYEMDTADTPSGFLRKKYVPVPLLGTVVMTYTVSAGQIDIEVDLTGMAGSWDKAYIMNEQGARFFTRYEEPGLAVEGPAFGIWQATDAPWGCIVAGDRSLRFCVETAPGIPRFYGRERYLQRYWIGLYLLSWAGIDLELLPPTEHFSYRVLVERLSDE